MTYGLPALRLTHGQRAQAQENIHKRAQAQENVDRARESRKGRIKGADAAQNENHSRTPLTTLYSDHAVQRPHCFHTAQRTDQAAAH